MNSEKVNPRAVNFKEAVEKDVNEKSEKMKRCRSDLETALTNDDEDHTSSDSR